MEMKMDFNLNSINGTGEPCREAPVLIQRGSERGTMETTTNQDVMKQFARLYDEVFSHDGYGEIRLEMKILRRGQKEVIIHCGKQYRFVVDFAQKLKANKGRPAMAGNHAG